VVDRNPTVIRLVCLAESCTSVLEQHDSAARFTCPVAWTAVACVYLTTFALSKLFDSKAKNSPGKGREETTSGVERLASIAGMTTTSYMFVPAATQRYGSHTHSCLRAAQRERVCVKDAAGKGRRPRQSSAWTAFFPLTAPAGALFWRLPRRIIDHANMLMVLTVIRKIVSRVGSVAGETRLLCNWIGI
jgi:hypothetical protein